VASETKFAGAGATQGGFTCPWTDPNNVGADDAAYANCNMDDMTFPEDQDYLVSSNHGFAVSGTIDGIEVEIERKRGAGSGSEITDYECKLVIGGSIVGDNKADLVTTWNTTDAIVTYGGASDLWGLTPTDSQINASDFGFAIRPMDSQERGLDIHVDYIKITVYYTEGEGDEEGIGARRGVLFGVGRGVLRGVGGAG